MALDPKAKYILDLMAAAGNPPLHQRTPEQARATLAIQPLAGEPEPVASVEDCTVPAGDAALPVRIYRPEATGPLPALVYYHGGGWVIGSLDTVDVPCRRLANRAGCVVVSVDYRLAPEHKFPTAAEDAYAAARWVTANAGALGVDPARVAVGGDSAGANLAAVVALMSRDRGHFRLCHQTLLYPVTHHAFDTASYRDNGEGYFLTRDGMAWFWDHYLADAQDGRHPYASPLLAPDHAGLPPALVITAEFDPLRDEGEAYGRRLAAAGVPVEVTRYDGMIHGFCWMPGALTQGGQALDQAADALRRAFAAQAIPN
ncbi:alpha/beta hydrolase [Cupriavidus necator]|uniref:Alpha/beta hydrolase n=1 Tax=Cupriavidus necator TaxID=106590 RepID=A0A367PK79_CUPNE|nr:alpha/beta hydrolase [Cupriavidus necator]QQX82834.1 alpha/beta hydrolase [Cupriavidus necator]RCJ07426.1 alpha/beta hydrolase [Cupriavidus necator]